MSRVPLVHVDEVLGGARGGTLVGLTPDEHHHLTAVLRLGEGDEVEVSDGRGGHAIAVLWQGGVLLTADATSVPPPRPRLRVVQALPKGRKLDDVVRATVELGVDELQPVSAERSVRQLSGSRAAKAQARWEALARAACEQSRRRHRPRVAAVVALDELAVDGCWLLAHPGADRALPDALAELPRDEVVEAGGVTIAVGPEGGWSEAEVARLRAAGATAVHLGPTVLRTEHAAAAACAVVAALLGRWVG